MVIGRSGPCSAALAALAVACGAAACRTAKPAAAPLPTPSEAPPQVQPPVAAALTPEVVATPAPPAATDPTVRRFDLVDVGDTTFTILIGREHWVRPGMAGVAVDPRRRDALVARFRVLGRTGDTATALVTGQTTRVLPEHVALIRQPVPGLLRRHGFWIGLLIGAAAGVGTGLAIRR